MKNFPPASVTPNPRPVHYAGMLDEPMFRPLDTRTLQASVDLYVDEPEWFHGPYVVPLLAWLLRDDPPWPGSQIPEGCFNHLVWALRGWTAFRGGGRLDDKVEKLREHLPLLITGVRTAIEATGARRLADVPEHSLDPLADALDGMFARTAAVVKGNESFVLPSKTAHLLFPAMIPAYDREVVADRIMDSLLPPRMNGRALYATWLKLCWWIIAQLRESTLLDAACEKVRDSLLDSWAVAVLDVGRPKRDAACAALLDSFVAEYALIGLQRQNVRLQPI